MHFSRDEHDLEISELLGEALMPRLQIETWLASEDYRTEIQNLVRDHKVGGFCVFGGTLETVSQATGALQGLSQSSHGIPLLFSADFEFGLPMRLTEGGTEFPDAMAIGKTGDPSFAFKVGEAIAKEMLSIGIQWNFAPVADINSNPKNPIINTRSFGGTADIVSTFSSAFVNGVQQAGGIGCLKHFPGHGDTAVDSHRALPVIEGGLSRFEGLEFIPFRRGLQAGAKTIMLGHIATPDLAKELGATDAEWLLPATLSRPIIQQVLRKSFGFEGVIVTDALEMHAISDGFGDEDAAFFAYAAGVDVLLLSPDSAQVHKRLLHEVETGKLSESHVRSSAGRVLLLKREFEARAVAGLGSYQDQHKDLAASVAAKALEISGNPMMSSNLIILHDSRGTAARTAEYFSEQLQAKFPKVRVHITDPEHISELKLSEPGAVTVATFNRARGFIDNGGHGTPFDHGLKQMLEHIGPKRVEGAILFGNPYLESFFTGANWNVKTFSESKASVDAVINLIKA